MSNSVSALQGKAYSGAVQIEELGLRGMITLRGDLGSAKLKAAVKAVTGVEVPAQGECAGTGEGGVAWMSPDELLVMVPYADAEAGVAKLSEALKGQHFLAANVSDARAVFSISGSGAREVLARPAPVDLSPEVFGPGMMRRTRLAQVPAAFWMRDAETFELICFRSVAGYVFDVLRNAANPLGGDGIG